MTKDELLAKLRELADDSDHEMAHVQADDLLLEWISDPEIEEAYHAIEKWYA